MFVLNMYCFIFFILALPSSLFGSFGQDVTIDRKILTEAQKLCQYTSFCEETPLLQNATPAVGRKSCCRDCSCKPDCVKSSSCCFSSPEPIARPVKEECMYPSVSQNDYQQIREQNVIFKTVVDVHHCSYDYITVNKSHSGNSMSKLCNSSKDLCDSRKNNSCDSCKFNNTNCGECQCSMRKQQDNGVEVLVVEKCICGKLMLKEGSCSCGDVKVAPWGSMLPVYSRTTRLLYKNPVCALCNGVTDGIVWIPIIQCNMDKFQTFDFSVEESKDCSIYFLEPQNIMNYLLPSCGLNDICEEGFQIPDGVNMTAKEIIDACHAEFYSMYHRGEKNVFCAICRGTRFKTRTCIDSGKEIRTGSDKITLLMTLDYLIEKTAAPGKPTPRQVPLACSSSAPNDCREVICPTGKIRDANGICTYVAEYTYVNGYFITLRLIPEKQEDMFGIHELVSQEKFYERNLMSPWPPIWVTHMIILEDSRIISSGVRKNETALIVSMGVAKPDKNQTRLLENIRRFLKKKWMLKLDFSVTFRTEISEYIYDKISGGINRLGVVDNNSNWNVLFKTGMRGKSLSHVKGFSIDITKMFFCQQIILDSHTDDYELRNSNRLLYLKSLNKSIFEANFIIDMNGQQKVRVCLEDTDFVIRVASVSSKNDVTICWYCSMTQALITALVFLH